MAESTSNRVKNSKKKLLHGMSEQIISSQSPIGVGNKSPTRLGGKHKKLHSNADNGNKVNKSMSMAKNAVMTVIEEASSPLTAARRRKGDSSSKRGESPTNANRKNKGFMHLQTMGMVGIDLHPLMAGDNTEGATGEEDSDQDKEASEAKKQKGSEEDSSDVESMLREMDPVKRHIKQLKLKSKAMELNRPKPLPQLSFEKRGWNAPQDQPYVPVGRMTELVSAVEQVRSNLPNTRGRFKKTTYRQMLVIKKRERDLADKRKNLRVSSADASARKKQTQPDALSQSSVDDEAHGMEDASRVVQKILPGEQGTLVQIRNYAYDQTLREMHQRRLSAPTGPRLNKIGRVAAGFILKKNEKRDDVEIKRKKKEEMRMSASPSVLKGQAQGGDTVGVTGEVDENGKPVIKSDIELQLEKEKSRSWIRKRNGKIYDEKIKNMILTTDNGSALLKQEIQESECRLAMVKLGKPLNQVVPPHPPNYFLTDKEEYFLGEKRVLRRQEREKFVQLEEPQEEVVVQEPRIEQLGKEFQTIASQNNEIIMSNDTGGFFITEQPIVIENQVENRRGVVRIPDLLGENMPASELSEEPVQVSQMFSQANDGNFEKVYRATTSQVKGVFLDRLKSRQDQVQFTSMEGLASAEGVLKSGKPSGREMLKHQRAHSFSTAAATTHGFYRSGNIIGMQQATSGLRMSDQNTLNSNLESERLLSAMTTGFGSKRNVGNAHQRVNSQQLHSSEQNMLRNFTSNDVNQTINILDSAPQLMQSQTENYRTQQQLKLNMSRSQGGQSSQMMTEKFNAKRLLQNAKTNRAKTIQTALKVDVSNRTNRVRYLQNLQKERIAKKKLDQAQGSNIFQGFSKDEIHEILVEMPQLKMMQKEKERLEQNGPQLPQFSNAQLIHLDSLNDIANRGAAEMRVRVMNQIAKRKTRIAGEVINTDNLYGINHPDFTASNIAIGNNNSAIFKQFQQNTNDGFEDDIPTNYKWDNTLKERLNFVDARQQTHLFNTFREEDFIHKIWDANGPDHRTMDSERKMMGQTAGSQKTLQRNKPPTLIEQIGTKFNEKQEQLQRQSTQNLSQPQLRKMQTSISGCISTQANMEGQKQVDEEMREFDHSEQVILMKLIDVFEKRQARRNERSQQTASTTSTAAKKAVGKLDSQQLLKHANSKQLGAKLNNKSSMAVVSVAQQGDDDASINNNRDADTNASNATLGLPPRQKYTKKSRQASDVSMRDLKVPIPRNKDSSQRDENSQRGQQKAMISTLMGPNQNDRKRRHQLKKDYRKFVIECITKEYWRAFEALVGANELEMELVIHSFNNNTFYKEAKDFLVTRGKFMSEDHLIHLKEDPKTILSLYRMFMLHYKTTQKGVVDTKLAVRKPKSKPVTSIQKPQMPSQQLASQFDEVEDSDYSDSDFQDLMSNKQVQENIRIFFDRMHELVNPIDQQRLKLDSVQQIKSTVKTFYKRKAEVSDKLLHELDQMSAERPLMISVKQGQFNDPDSHNQANLHAQDNVVKLPMVQQCKTRMTDIRLNAELYRLRKFKNVAQNTAVWYNELAARVLAEQIQDEPLVLYMLDQIKHVIEIGEVFTRFCFKKLMNTFDALDADRPEVIMVSQFLNELLPYDDDHDDNTVAGGDSVSHVNLMDQSRALNQISMTEGLGIKDQRSKLSHKPKPARSQPKVPSKVTFDNVR